eukprot:2356214-Alexandrium_andersonii.AAC.1
MREAWQPVYQGNGEITGTATRFVQKYWSHMYHEPTMAERDIDERGLLALIRAAPRNAGGPDGWLPSELVNMPVIAVRELRRLYLEVEAGSGWPAQLTAAKAAFISKDATFSGDPMQFRALLVTSFVYRIWGRYRLRQSGEWVRRWCRDGLYSGVRGAGAQDA